MRIYLGVGILEGRTKLNKDKNWAEWVERIRESPPRTAYQPEPVRREPTKVTEKKAPTSKTAAKRAHTETAVKRAHTEALPLALTLALDLDLINRLFAAGQKEDNAEYRRQARNLCMLLMFSWSLGLGGNPVGLGLRCSAAFRCPRGQTGQHFRGGPGAGEQIYFPTFDPGEENGDPLSPRPYP